MIYQDLSAIGALTTDILDKFVPATTVLTAADLSHVKDLVFSVANMTPVVSLVTTSLDAPLTVGEFKKTLVAHLAAIEEKVTIACDPAQNPLGLETGTLRLMHEFLNPTLANEFRIHVATAREIIDELSPPFDDVGNKTAEKSVRRMLETIFMVKPTKLDPMRPVPIADALRAELLGTSNATPASLKHLIS